MESFTPVRRREDTIASNRVSVGDGQTWNTAKCNRLLRPLISRVSALGRLSPSENPTTDKCTVAHRANSDYAQDEHSTHEKDGDSGDDEWAPVKKKLKRTYSARSGKGTRGRPSKVSIEMRNQGYSDASHIYHRMPFVVPGELALSTPLLNRAKGGLHQELQHRMSSSFDEDSGIQKRPRSRFVELSETLRQLRRKTDPARCTLYEGIYHGLEVLLKATRGDHGVSTQSRSGTRSLFDSCLRKVPAVIKEEEAELASEAAERSAVEVTDVSSEIYAELEALGHGDRGWKHLRTMVRAHGIQIVGDAIAEGLVRPDFVGALVWLCVHTASLDEAETLISCFLKTSACSEPKSVHSRMCDDPGMVAFSVLEKFARDTGRRSFQIIQLTGMLVTGKLPLAWLATREFGRVWIHVIQSSAFDAESSIFLTAVIPKICASGTKTLNYASAEGIMLKALDATLASVLTALSAITLLIAEKDDQTPQTLISQQPGSALRQCLVTCALHPSPLNNSRSALLAISNVLISPDDETISESDSMRKVSKMLSSIKSTEKSSESLASFVCSVAFCCGKGLSNTGFKHLKLLHNRLRKYLAHPACPNKHVIRVVIIDSAFSFSRKNDANEHLDYAFDMEFHEEQHIADMHSRSPTETGGGNPVDASAGFRWEEGISEWVTKTPAFSMKKAKAKAAPRRPLSPSAHVDDIYSDSPVVSRHNLRRSGKRPAATATAPLMFRQVTKQSVQVRISKTDPSEEDHHSGNGNGTGTRRKNPHLPSESEDLDPAETSFSTSSASDTSALAQSSSSSQQPGIHGTQTQPINKNTHVQRSTARRSSLRLQSRQPSSQNWEDKCNNLYDLSDDELSSSISIWDTYVKRNQVSVIILQEKPNNALNGVVSNNTTTTSTAISSEIRKDSSSIRSSRGGSRKSSSPMTQKKIALRHRTVIDDSEDELCL